MIRIGYVGVNTILPSASKTFRLAGYSDERMIEVTRGNLSALREILQWNLDHDITLFRITSQLVPFGSHPVNSGLWQTALKKEFRQVGQFGTAHSMRLTMHPGQYTVLNTPNETFLTRSINDLQYHQTVLSMMGLDNSCKIILHGGGAYGDRETSLNILRLRVAQLPANIRARLVLENDERIFNAAEIWETCRQTGIPGVLDVFHHEILPSLEQVSIRELIIRFGDTWHGQRQKIHYSDQAPGKNKGAHSESVDVTQFGRLYKEIYDLDLDIMIEAKDKQTSVLKLREAYPELR
ncbi:UV DNA damage endonuclease [Chitinispirillum alkaliphilum]|nr:UV DNA damage endonuclease [Chitinispirillum alkaliphilum]